MGIDLAYAELGLQPGASEAQVKAAWRKLVSRWHPDRNDTADALRRMQRINFAYERIRLAGFAQRANDAPGEDVPAHPPTRAGGAERVTIRRKVRLSLEETALGCTRVLRGRLSMRCTACEGLGHHIVEDGCAMCGGSGSIRRHLWYGLISSVCACPECRGDGAARNACPACAGRGRTSHGYQQRIDIPAGMRDGDVLQTPGDDATGRFEIGIEIAPHDFFTIDGNGVLRCDMPVNGFAWMAGGWVDVPTLTGMHKMRLQRGHHVYRLRGQGVPVARDCSERGDYVVSVTPIFPASLDAEQHALLERLVASCDAAEARHGDGAIGEWRRTLAAWDRGRDGAPAG